jgi:mRNA interferase MazF
MTLRRGDVVLAGFPFASGAGGKRRPCVIVQNDADNRKLANTVIVQVTSNLARVGDKSHVRIDVGTPSGQQDGLLHDSLISCNNIATIEQSLVDKVIGSLSPDLVEALEKSLKGALAIS